MQQAEQRLMSSTTTSRTTAATATTAATPSTPGSYLLKGKSTQTQRSPAAPSPALRGGRGRGRGEIASPSAGGGGSGGRGRGRGGRGGGARGRGGAQGIVKGRGRGRGKSFPDDEEEQAQAGEEGDEAERDDEGEERTNGGGGGGRRKSSESIDLAFHFPEPEDDEPPRLDLDAADSWIYPSNYPRRDYQYSITRKALFRNTLVSLPTGLGKTFIAAVVMYNFYRWFPEGKVVFMAPTKPLVAQQITACYQIMGLPEDDTVTMTGQISPEKRREAWRSRRVFYVTPQILTNDISRQACDAKSIVCLVVDEAHRALGNYAYCTVVKAIASATRHFRILALSATPGSNMEQVQQVIHNLLISNLEVRTSEDIDVRAYIHSTKLEMVRLSLTPELNAARSLFIELLKIPLDKLHNMRAFWTNEPEKASRFLLLDAKRKFEGHPSPAIPPNAYGQVHSQFALAITLYHAWGLLNTYGFRATKNYLSDLREEVQANKEGTAKSKKALVNMPQFHNLMLMLEEFADNAGFNHPKLQKVEELVLQHFQRSPGGNTRVMIFAQFRDTVEEICELLAPHAPHIKSMPFVGQGVGRSSAGFTQKEQSRVIEEFKKGGYNTLVSTCIGEEGLDIGEVDLIICFDAQASPTRMVQRMGRTGRKRDGRCVVLVTEGAEEAVFKKSQQTSKSINTKIMKPESFALYKECPRMIPVEIKPKVDERHMTIASPKKKVKGTKGGKSAGVVPRGAYLDKHQAAWLRSNYGATDEVELPALSLDTHLDRQAMPTPVHDIAHSDRALLLMNVMQFMDDNSADYDDAYGDEMQQFLDMDYIEPETVAARPATRSRAAKKPKLTKPPPEEEDPLEFDFHAALHNVKRPAAAPVRNSRVSSIFTEEDLHVLEEERRRDNDDASDDDDSVLDDWTVPSSAKEPKSKAKATDRAGPQPTKALKSTTTLPSDSSADTKKKGAATSAKATASAAAPKPPEPAAGNITSSRLRNLQRRVSFSDDSLKRPKPAASGPVAAVDPPRAVVEKQRAANTKRDKGKEKEQKSDDEYEFETHDWGGLTAMDVEPMVMDVNEGVARNDRSSAAPAPPATALQRQATPPTAAGAAHTLVVLSDDDEDDAADDFIAAAERERRRQVKKGEKERRKEREREKRRAFAPADCPMLMISHADREDPAVLDECMLGVFAATAGSGGSHASVSPSSFFPSLASLFLASVTDSAEKELEAKREASLANTPAAATSAASALRPAMKQSPSVPPVVTSSPCPPRPPPTAEDSALSTPTSVPSAPKPSATSSAATAAFDSSAVSLSAGQTATASSTRAKPEEEHQAWAQAPSAFSLGDDSMFDEIALAIDLDGLQAKPSESDAQQPPPAAVVQRDEEKAATPQPPVVERPTTKLGSRLSAKRWSDDSELRKATAHGPTSPQLLSVAAVPSSSPSPNPSPCLPEAEAEAEPSAAAALAVTAAAAAFLTVAPQQPQLARRSLSLKRKAPAGPSPQQARSTTAAEASAGSQEMREDARGRAADATAKAPVALQHKPSVDQLQSEEDSILQEFCTPPSVARGATAVDSPSHLLVNSLLSHEPAGAPRHRRRLRKGAATAKKAKQQQAASEVIHLESEDEDEEENENEEDEGEEEQVEEEEEEIEEVEDEGEDDFEVVVNEKQKREPNNKRRREEGPTKKKEKPKKKATESAMRRRLLANMVDDEASCDDEDDDDDDDDEDENGDLDSFICDGTIEEESPSDEASDAEEPENDLAIYRQSMLSQASARPANFRTPKRQVPNKYKMRFVEHTPETSPAPRSWETSPATSSFIASSPDSSTTTTPSIKRGAPCVPQPGQAVSVGRRLDFGLAGVDDHVDNDAEAEVVTDDDYGDDDLVMWGPRGGSSSSKTSTMTTTTKTSIPPARAPATPLSAPALAANSSHTATAETPNWTLGALDEFEGLDLSTAFPQLPSTLDEPLPPQHEAEAQKEPAAKKLRKSNVTIQIEETAAAAVKQEPDDYNDEHYNDDAANWSLGVSFSFSSDTSSSPTSPVKSATPRPVSDISATSNSHHQPALRRTMSIPPSPYLVPSTTTTTTTTQPTASNKKRSLTSLTALSSSPSTSTVMSPPSSPNAFLTPPAMAAPPTRSPLRRGVTLSALSAASSPAPSPQSPFPLDVNSPSRLPAHLLPRMPSTPELRRARKKTPPVIIVSSVQLGRSQIPQILRNKWKAPPVVYSLPPPGDFLVSCRNGGLAVIRKTQKELEEGGQRDKVSQVIADAEKVGLRLVFLLEQDEKSGIAPGGRNYVESMDALMQLTQGSVHYSLLHSSSQAHSADLIYHLARKEMLDGGGMVGLGADFLDANARRLAFLRELPGLGIVPVLALLSRFENLRDIINAGPADLRHQLSCSRDHHDLVAQLHACFGSAGAAELTARLQPVAPLTPLTSPSSSSSSSAASSLTDVEDATPEATNLLRGQPKFNIASRLASKPAAPRAPPRGRGGAARPGPRGGRGRGRGRGRGG